MKYEFFTGSYGKNEEESIVRFQLDGENGTLTKVCGYKGMYFPSYVVLNRNRTVLYAVEERTPLGFVHALQMNEQCLRRCSSLSTNGADPCYIGLEPEGKFVLAANYTSGSLAVFKTDGSGVITEMTDFVKHEGKGPNPERQEGPHVHYCRVRNSKVFTMDLGLDKAFIYDLDLETGNVTDTKKTLEFPKGSGPRHLEFDPEREEYIYAVCELGCQAAVFKEENGEYILKQMISTLPDDFNGKNISAAIRAKNGYLFVSNRGHDSIAVFKIGEDGLLTRTDIAHTGGKTPRDFNIMGDYLAAANQDSNNITVLKINWKDGSLSSTGISAETVRPTCIEIK